MGEHGAIQPLSHNQSTFAVVMGLCKDKSYLALLGQINNKGTLGKPQHSPHHASNHCICVTAKLIPLWGIHSIITGYSLMLEGGGEEEEDL